MDKILSKTESIRKVSVAFFYLAVPEIITEPASQSVTVFQQAQFKCWAYIRSEIPGLTLTWTDRNTGLAVSEEDGFKSTHEVLETTGIILVTSVLNFCGATEPTSYSLSCLASASNVNVTSDFTLSVISESGIIQQHRVNGKYYFVPLSPTVDISTHGETEIDVETTLSLTCRASGNFYPDTIFWAHGGEVLSSSSRVSITTRKYGGYCESELNVSSVELADGGMYSCIVSGGADTAAAAVAEINVTVREGMCRVPDICHCLLYSIIPSVVFVVQSIRLLVK